MMATFETTGLALLVAATEGRTQAEIATALRCSQPQISDYFSGKSRPGAARRVLIEAVYGVPATAWLLPDEMPPAPPASDDAPPVPAAPASAPEAAPCPS